MAPPFYFKTSSGASPRRVFLLHLFSLLLQRQVAPAGGFKYSSREEKMSPLFFPKNLVKNWKKSRDFALHSKAGFRGSQFFGNFRGNRKTTEVNFSLVLSFVW